MLGSVLLAAFAAIILASMSTPSILASGKYIRKVRHSEPSEQPNDKSLKLCLGLGANNLKQYEIIVKKINDFEPEISKLNDEELKNKTKYFINQYHNEKKSIENILPEAFAVVREASIRTLKILA